MRVCIVADSASVRFGGEAILPYHYFRLLSERGIDAWLVVHDRTRPELQQLLPELQHRILYSPDLWIHKQVSKLITLLPRRVSESTLGLMSLLLTQYYQRKLVRSLIQAGRIDIVHQPTPVSPRLPSLMFDLGVPVVIGPLNGGMDYPEAFRDHESGISHSLVSAGRSLSESVNRRLPGKLQAAIVLVANGRTREALPQGLRGTVLDLVENAVDLKTWAPASNQTPQLHHQFLFLGRLVDWKRLDLALRALVQLPEATLVVVGDGVMAEPWEQMCRELGIADRVRFLGWLSQTECARYLAQSAALILPSIYECGGAVVLEAMAASRPVIATRWGGPVDYLDESCGILIPPEREECMVRQFAEAMALIMEHPEIGARLGSSGRQRVQQHFTWQRKIEQIEEIYRQAIHAHTGTKERAEVGVR